MCIYYRRLRFSTRYKILFSHATERTCVRFKLIRVANEANNVHFKIYQLKITKTSATVQTQHVTDLHTFIQYNETDVRSITVYTTLQRLVLFVNYYY